MDLLDRGRSLSELGRTLRWTDLNALLIHLPATSHVHRVLSPDRAQLEARLEEWTSPEVVLLGALIDAQEAEILARAGEKPPAQGVVARMLQKIAGTNPRPSGETAVVKKPPVSASAIRQAVKERETPAE